MPALITRQGNALQAGARLLCSCCIRTLCSATAETPDHSEDNAHTLMGVSYLRPGDAWEVRECWAGCGGRFDVARRFLEFTWGNFCCSQSNTCAEERSGMWPRPSFRTCSAGITSYGTAYCSVAASCIAATAALFPPSAPWCCAGPRYAGAAVGIRPHGGIPRRRERRALPHRSGSERCDMQVLNMQHTLGRIESHAAQPR